MDGWRTAVTLATMMGVAMARAVGRATRIRTRVQSREVDMLQSNRERREPRRSSRARTEVFVAVVHAADGVRLATAAESRAELVCSLADYVRGQAEYALSVEHARHVRGLLARGELEAAVEVYFGTVGQRWDEEWLVTAALERDHWWSMGAKVDAVAQVTAGRTRSMEA